MHFRSHISSEFNVLIPSRTKCLGKQNMMTKISSSPANQLLKEPKTQLATLIPSQKVVCKNINSKDIQFSRKVIFFHHVFQVTHLWCVQCLIPSGAKCCMQRKDDDIKISCSPANQLLKKAENQTSYLNSITNSQVQD